MKTVRKHLILNTRGYSVVNFEISIHKTETAATSTSENVSSALAISISNKEGQRVGNQQSWITCGCFRINQIFKIAPTFLPSIVKLYNEAQDLNIH